jgi:hypothetical protein
MSGDEFEKLEVSSMCYRIESINEFFILKKDK